MSFRAAALAALFAVASSPAFAGCETLRLTVDPASKASDVAEVLKRRLTAFGAADPKVAPEGDGLTVLLPDGAADTLLTRPGKVEFRLIAEPSEPGALPFPRLDGAASEPVSPQIILDESHLREVQASGAAIRFHFDPPAMRNLMASSTESIGRKLAILIDGRIVADPQIRAPIASAVGEIPAGTPASAVELAQALAGGKLPARVEVKGRETAACSGG